jgi:hypothetical protein
VDDQRGKSVVKKMRLPEAGPSGCPSPIALKMNEAGSNGARMRYEE